MNFEEKLASQLKPEEYLINIGPQHPSTHGVLRLLVTLEGEIIKNVEPDIGYLHRCFEKICENRTYPMGIPMTDRMDYLGAMLNNLGYALAAEKLGEIEVPVRSQWIRIIVCELNRIASHLLWLAAFGADTGALTMFMFGLRERELVLDILEQASGSRLTYGYIRIGGVARDVDKTFIKKTNEFIKLFPAKLKEYETLLGGNPIFHERTKNVGTMSRETALSFGVTGPMLRSTGLAQDLRKNCSYLPYDQLDFEVASNNHPDCYGRYLVRMKEMGESLKIVEQALEKLQDGEIMPKMKPIFKPKKGEAYVKIEAPRGQFGVYMESDGKNKPHRVKFRAPSFSNLSVINTIAKGGLVADLIVILGSIDIVLGDVDR
ncbi:MAG: NADH-quinone oxidoreductase subunit D [Candidatus Cloacimonetes bacterium]|nr:NADH-quinone oxidoreductase subunit D [Candidatus Cloacimonadota bacterium]